MNYNKLRELKQILKNVSWPQFVQIKILKSKWSFHFEISSCFRACCRGGKNAWFLSVDKQIINTQVYKQTASNILLFLIYWKTSFCWVGWLKMPGQGLASVEPTALISYLISIDKSFISFDSRAMFYLNPLKFNIGLIKGCESLFDWE